MTSVFTLFDSVGSTSTGAELDVNFATVAQQSISPCSVGGTGAAYTMTQFAGTPIIPAYSNFVRVTGVVSITNTGPITLSVGALPALPVYKDSVTGPVPLVAGDLVRFNSFSVIYDALVTGTTPGWHLVASPASLVGVYMPLAGGAFSGPVNGTSISLSGSINCGGGASVAGVGQFGSIISAGGVSATSAGFLGVSVTGLTIGASGASVSQWNSAQPTVAMSLSSNATGSTVVSVPGCAVGDLVYIGPPITAVAAAIVWTGVATGPGSVTMLGHAPGGGGTLASAIFHVATVRMIP